MSKKPDKKFAEFRRKFMKDGEIETAVVLEAARREDSMFISYIGKIKPDHEALENLRDDPRHTILEAVRTNDLAKLFYLNAVAHGIGDVNKRWYWHPENKPERAYFLTTAHLTRSLEMALYLKGKNVDFNKTDADGRLPLYFIARHAKDRWLFPTLVKTFNVNANNSGRYMSEEFNIVGANYDPPIMQAIKAGNTHAVKGLELLAPKEIDLNFKTQADQTPLMYAVLLADEAERNFDNGDIGAFELSKRLWIARFLASSPFVDESVKDISGWQAKDFAFETRTKKVVQDGLDRRDALKKLYDKKPHLRFF